MINQIKQIQQKTQKAIKKKVKNWYRSEIQRELFRGNHSKFNVFQF